MHSQLETELSKGTGGVQTLRAKFVGSLETSESSETSTMDWNFVKQPHDRSKVCPPFALGQAAHFGRALVGGDQSIKNRMDN